MRRNFKVSCCVVTSKQGEVDMPDEAQKPQKLGVRVQVEVNCKKAKITVDSVLWEDPGDDGQVNELNRRRETGSFGSLKWQLNLLAGEPHQPQNF